MSECAFRREIRRMSSLRYLSFVTSGSYDDQGVAIGRRPSAPVLELASRLPEHRRVRCPPSSWNIGGCYR
jgi:hypothetical protein